MSMDEKADLLICGSHVVTMNPAQPLIKKGAVAISGDTIIDLGDADALRKRHPGAERIEEPHGLIMPGLINAHTHASMSLFRGMADDLPLMQWLQDYIFPLEATLTGELVYQGALLSMCEMIKSGTTSFCDMYLFTNDVARAVEQSGMRAWLGEALYDFPSPNYGELEHGFAYSQALIDQYRGHPLINITLVAHAVYTCAPSMLQRAVNMAREQGIVLNMHLAENEQEQRDCLERYGKRPVAHLDALGILGPNLIAAHCVILNEAEISLLARRGVKVAHCPESNLKLGSGIAPVEAMLAAGVTVGLGTDGSASNNDVDLFGEMSSMAKIHKGVQKNPQSVSAEQVLYAATLGSAALLGAERRIGSLERGKQADCIVLDLNQPHLTPLYHPVSHLVYAAKGSDVLHSVIAGQIVMRNRRLSTLNEGAILDQARRIGANFIQAQEARATT